MSVRERMSRQAEEEAKRPSTLKEPSDIFTRFYAIPESIPQWTPKKSAEGVAHIIDLVMFPVGANFPWGVWKQPYKIGDYAHTLVVDVHKGVGPEKAWIVCPKNNYGERCPICEEMKTLQDNEPDKDKRNAIWKERRTSRRQFYMIVVRDNGEEEDKGVQFWEVASNYMFDPIEKIKYSGRGGNLVMYWHPDKGKSIRFVVTKKPNEAYDDFGGHQFVDRTDDATGKTYVIEDEYLDFAEKNPPDTFLKRMTYDEVAEIYFSEAMTKENREPQQPEPTRRRKPTVQEEPPFEPDPSKKKEEPEESKSECPNGHTMGADYLKHTECDDCDARFYDICEEMKRALNPRRRGRPSKQS